MINKLIDGYKYFSGEEKESLKTMLEQMPPMNEESAKIAKILMANNADYLTIASGIFLADFRKNQHLLDDVEFLHETDKEECLGILRAVLKIEEVNISNNEISTENIKNLLLSIANDIRVVLIKLADVVVKAQIFNDKLDKNVSEEEKIEAQSLHLLIKELYAPISARLGLSFIKNLLQDYNIRYYHKSEYDQICNELDKICKNRNEEIEINISKINQILTNSKINAKVYGRVKHISSIYNKLKDKKYSISQIYDLLAVRIVVDSVEKCYEALALINANYTPIDDRFKDYIARPKPNGYQSIHTTVITENNYPLEIQIRTHQMHEFAEYGVAAHFLYKEKQTKKSTLDEKLIWVKKIIESKEFSSAQDYLTELKNDLYANEIFVQSPLGKVISLKENSSPIDFAYAIHSDVGNHCVGAKVNGKLMPLSTPLNNGDVVEILTNSNAKPSRDWMKFINTKEARNKLNAYFRKELKDENIKRGKQMLEETCKSKHIELKSLLVDDWLEELFDKWSLKSIDDLFASVGHGSLTSTQVVNKLLSKFRQNQKEEEQAVVKFSKAKASEKGVVFDSGVSGLLVRFAKCCLPVPGDEIVGFISHGRGVTIHTKDCKNVKALCKDRLINAKFAEEQKEKFNAHLTIVASKNNNVVLNITKVIINEKFDLTGVNVSNTAGQIIVEVYVDVKNLTELKFLINKLEKISDVVEVKRAKGE
ncbi:MAG: RelA/SpoT family protein [Christensenellales bacterium]